MSQQNHVSARVDGTVWNSNDQYKHSHEISNIHVISNARNLTLNSDHLRAQWHRVLASRGLMACECAGGWGHTRQSILSWGWLNVARMNHDFPHCRSQSRMSHEQVLYGNRQGWTGAQTDLTSYISEDYDLEYKWLAWYDMFWMYCSLHTMHYSMLNLTKIAPQLHSIIQYKGTTTCSRLNFSFWHMQIMNSLKYFCMTRQTLVVFTQCV